MTDEKWTAVDRYITELVVHPDRLPAVEVHLHRTFSRGPRITESTRLGGSADGPLIVGAGALTIRNLPGMMAVASTTPWS